MPEKTPSELATELNSALSAIAGMMLDLYTKQIAILDLVKSLGSVPEAIEKANRQLSGHPALRSLRIGTTASALEVAERAFRDLGRHQ